MIMYQIAKEIIIDYEMPLIVDAIPLNFYVI